MNILTKPRYSLDSSSKKYFCPACKQKRFVLYLDNTTGEPIAPIAGRYDRSENCRYHFTPREFFAHTVSGSKHRSGFPTHRNEPKKAGRLPYSMVEATLKRYEENQLVNWLATLPGWSFAAAAETAMCYRIGTGSKDVNGWPVFWQIDRQDKVRSGKLIRYNALTGKRIKEGYAYDWIHSRLIKAGRLPDDPAKWSLDQCLFGMHLLKEDPKKPVAITESEKTAVIASRYMPQLIWMAAGSSNGLKAEKLHPLRGRKIFLFPDKGKAYDEWSAVAKDLKPVINLHVSDLLEQKAPAEHDGYDIADYLTAFDLSTFPGALHHTNPDYPAAAAAATPVEGINGKNPYTGEIFEERGYPADWDDMPRTESMEVLKAKLEARKINPADFFKKTDPKAALIIKLFDAVPE